MVQDALRRHGGKITSAALELGISRPTLYELMEKLGIEREAVKTLATHCQGRGASDFLTVKWGRACCPQVYGERNGLWSDWKPSAFSVSGSFTKE